MEMWEVALHTLEVMGGGGVGPWEPLPGPANPPTPGKWQVPPNARQAAA